MYTVIGGVMSRTFRVLWLLEELGVDYQRVAAGPHSGEVRAHNPSGKVPVLISDGHSLTDSVAIMTFLSDRHSAFGYPPGSLERARQDAMTNRILDEFDALIWAAARHSFILPEEQRRPEVKESLRWEFAKNAAALNEEIEVAQHLAGETPTLPDFLLTHCLYWAKGAKFPYDAPGLDALAQRMRDRPAFQRVAAMN